MMIMCSCSQDAWNVAYVMLVRNLVLNIVTGGWDSMSSQGQTKLAPEELGGQVG